MPPTGQTQDEDRKGFLVVQLPKAQERLEKVERKDGGVASGEHLVQTPAKL